jgi:hypothetical protein
MQNSRKKKSIEELHFEYFKEKCKDLPSFVCIKHDDNPDFLCKQRSGVLGVELTQLFKIRNHPNAPQSLESFRTQIVDCAKKLCEEEGIPPLQVRMWFDFNQTVPKNRISEIKRLSLSLAEIVKKWHQENPSELRGVRNPSSEIPVPFSNISIIRRASGHNWAVNTAAHQLNFPTDDIQCCINEKNRRYEEYLKRCDECWLLIAVDIFRDSQSFEMPNLIDHRFESKFERVFYMDASHRKELRELSINRLKASL